MSIDEVRDLVARGEFLLAHDRAASLLERGEQRVELAYLATSALARSGATDQAEKRFVELGLDRAHELGAVGTLAEDIDSLFARIAKDRALSHSGPDRVRLAAVAARRYEQAFERHGGAYPCINAATMWLVAGDRARSLQLAVTAADLARGDDYWSVVTRAEAALVADDPSVTYDLVHAAARESNGSYAARASTCRQLRLICGLVDVDPTILEPLRNPPIVHFAGHRIAADDAEGRFAAHEEPRVAAEIAAELDESRPAFGFGSLASGGDILIAEALLARGAELHVLLPFARDDFVHASVSGGGDAWVRRFDACIDRATSVSYTTDGPFIGDDVSFQLCSSVAMGDALRHARQLEAEAHQLVVWDGDDHTPTTAAGTASDVRVWQATGRSTRIIRTGGTSSPKGRHDPTTPPRERTQRAILFADIAGFSSLDDLQMPVFMETVMSRLAETVDELGDDVLLRRTWGDGIHLAFESVDCAAACAVSLQRCMAAIDVDAHGLGTIRGMRVGAHVGPVYEEIDPFTHELSYMGANVTRAARIEPGTPEGEVYVTHPFAALAELHGAGRWSCQYVGIVPAAKDHGRLPMYLLRSVTPGTGL